MAYSKTNYVDGVTPLNAKNFNNNESALDQTVKDVATISQALVQVDDKVDGKSDIGHTHSELHSHSNKSVLDGVTSAKVTEWNNKSNFSGNYNDLTNKPTIPTVDVNKSYVDTELAKKSNVSHEHSEYTTETRVSNMIAEAQLGGGEVDLSGYATKDDLKTKADAIHNHNYNDLTNKPTIPTVDVDKAYVDGELAKKSNTGHRHDASEIDNLPTSGGSSTVIVDNLESTSTTAALSANQGKVLDNKISILNSESVKSETYEGGVDLTVNPNLPNRVTEAESRITVLSDTINNHLSNHPSGDSVLTDPNGNKYKLIVDINGNLIVQSIGGIDSYLDGRLLVHEENFVGDVLNENVFGYELGNTRGGRIETSTKENVTIENNTLVITAKKGGNTIGGRSWTSGAIHTCEKHAYLYGRWEAKIKLPNKMGAFPAFWTCGDRMVRNFDISDIDKSEKFIGVPYPWGGEIDIMEQAPGNWGGLNKTGACFWKAAGDNFYDESVSNFSGVFYKNDIDTTEWHIYAMEWTDTYIEIFVDGVSIGKKNLDSDMDYYKEPQFYILNLAMGSGGGNPGNESEMKMLVDWVRVYSPTNITSLLPIESIKIEDFASINIGETKKLSYTITPSNVGNRALKWTSSDNNICSAYGGYLTPKKPGTVNITVTTANGKKDTISVTCIGDSIPCTEVQLNKNQTSLSIGKTELLNVTYLPEDTTQNSVFWTTDNPSVATVDGGIVSAIGEGQCNIKAINSYNSSLVANCSVNVVSQTSTNVLYENMNEVVLTGNGTNVIDTGVKLFDSNKAFTICLDFENTESEQEVSGQLLNCMYDDEPYNGVCIKYGGSGKHQMDYNGVVNFDSDGLGKIVQYYANRSKLIIYKEANSNVLTYKLDDEKDHILNGTVPHNNIDNTLTIGAYVSTTNSKGRFWKGTIHSIVVYDNVLSESEMISFLQS